MQSVATPWAATSDAEATARLQRVRASLTPLQDVYAAFAPWQHISTGVHALDTLLRRTGVCGGVSGADEASREGAGGFPVGGLHELYGPPGAGKSWLLHRIGAAYVRRMTAYRQFYYDERERLSSWDTAGVVSDTDGDGTGTAGACEDGEGGNTRRGISPEEAGSAVPDSAVADWDLYVCRVSGAGAGAAAPLAPTCPQVARTTATPEVRQWIAELLVPFEADTPHCTYSAAVSPSPTHRRQQQREYAMAHVHVCEVHAPNELLDFLACLAEAPPVPAMSSHTAAVAAAAEHHAAPGQLFATTAEAPTRAGRKRDRAAAVDVPLLASSTSPVAHHGASVPQRGVWRLQRQRLLLLDGLNTLWLHPSLGHHSATHGGQWFAAELHRHLRRFATPVQTPFPVTSSVEPQVVYSTVVLTNGCHGGNAGGVQAPTQAAVRLAALAAHHGGGGQAPSPLSWPRPAGSAVWWHAADTRCLLEPAHPALLSIPATPPSHATASASPRPLLARAAHPVEAVATLLKGGTRVAATWVPHMDEDVDEE